MALVRFRVAVQTQPGEYVCIVGTSALLGSSSVKRAVRLKTRKGRKGWWTSDDIRFDKGEQEVVYRIFVRRNGQEDDIRWEAGLQERSVRFAPWETDTELAGSLHVVSVQFDRHPAGAADSYEWPLGLDGSRASIQAFFPEDRCLRLGCPDSERLSAMVVYPGGGYGMLTSSHEGQQIAEWLAGEGIVAFVLSYSVSPIHFPVQLHEGNEAIRWVRRNAIGLAIDPARVGVIGFSAGAHLAGLVHTSCGSSSAGEASSNVAVLCYPVVTLDHAHHCAHAGSRKNLLGASSKDQLLSRELSLENRTWPTAPVFMWHTCSDSVVPLNNVYLLAAALSRMAIAHELHVYTHDGVKHGCGLFGADGQRLPWAAAMLRWLLECSFLRRECSAHAGTSAASDKGLQSRRSTSPDADNENVSGDVE